MKLQKQLSWLFTGLILLGIGLVIFPLFQEQRQAKAPVVAGAPGVTAVPRTTSATATPEAWLLPFPTQTPTTTQRLITVTPLPTATTTPTPTARATMTLAATMPPPATSTVMATRAPATATAVTPTTPVIPTATPTTAVAPTATATAVALPPTTTNPIVPGFRERFGVAGGNGHLINAVNAGLPAGLFVNWRVDPTQPIWYGVRFWHTVRVHQAGVRSNWADIDRVLAEQPGAVWVIGNEPDVYVQDGVDPQTYARIYHETYTYIKARDPNALVAIGSVAQPTPLRRAYLDIVLDTYQANYGAPMPIDIWTVHAFVFREEAGSWGVGIPPGMGGAGAKLYEVSEHGSLAIFKQNLIDFRAWMAQRGYADRPLAVTEYGIVMPHDYGYPPETVAVFMTQTFDFFLNAANSTGYAADGGRLVQWWVWFSLYEEQEGYGTGNLVDGQGGQLTPLGQVFADYVNGR